MTGRPPKALGDAPDPRQGGFALLIVLWSLVLLSLLVTHVITTGRGEARIAANLKAGAIAQAAADGAIYTAIFRVMDASTGHWAADGAPHGLTFGEASARLRITSPAGAVNPNMVTKEMMSALLRVLGTAPAEADSLAGAISDWGGRVFHDDQREARMIPYRVAGLDYGPPLSPIESLEELSRVRGMTPALLDRLAPHLSLHRMAIPDPMFADPEVRQALQILQNDRQLPLASDAGRQAQAETVVIDATATAQDAHFSRRAVVSIDPALGRGYMVLSWEDGS